MRTSSRWRSARRPGAALAQLRERGYADKYRRPERPVRLVGIHFSEKTRNIVDFEMAEA